MVWGGGCGSGVEPASYYWICWFDSPGLYVVVSLGKMLSPITAPDVLDSTTAISVWVYVWITVSRFGHKCLLNAVTVNGWYWPFHYVNHMLEMITSPMSEFSKLLSYNITKIWLVIWHVGPGTTFNHDCPPTLTWHHQIVHFWHKEHKICGQIQ